MPRPRPRTPPAPVPASPATPPETPPPPPDPPARREVWSLHDPEGDGKVEAAKLPIIISELEPPLGVRGLRASPAYVQQLIMSCDIPSRDGHVSFHEVLYALAQRAALDSMPDLSGDLPLLVQKNHDDEVRFWKQLNRNVGHNPANPPKYSVGHYHAALYVQAAVRGFLARYEIKRRLNGALGGADGTGGAPTEGGRASREEGAARPARGTGSGRVAPADGSGRIVGTMVVTSDDGGSPAAARPEGQP